jgi:hypothetical protein
MDQTNSSHASINDIHGAPQRRPPNALRPSNNRARLAAERAADDERDAAAERTVPDSSRPNRKVTPLESRHHTVQSTPQNTAQRVRAQAFTSPPGPVGSALGSSNIQESDIQALDSPEPRRSFKALKTSVLHNFVAKPEEFWKVLMSKAPAYNAGYKSDPAHPTARSEDIVDHHNTEDALPSALASSTSESHVPSQYVAAQYLVPSEAPTSLMEKRPKPGSYTLPPTRAPLWETYDDFTNLDPIPRLPTYGLGDVRSNNAPQSRMHPSNVHNPNRPAIITKYGDVVPGRQLKVVLFLYRKTRTGTTLDLRTFGLADIDRVQDHERRDYIGLVDRNNRHAYDYVHHRGIDTVPVNIDEFKPEQRMWPTTVVDLHSAQEFGFSEGAMKIGRLPEASYKKILKEHEYCMRRAACDVKYEDRVDIFNTTAPVRKSLPSNDSNASTAPPESARSVQVGPNKTRIGSYEPQTNARQGLHLTNP